jgi:regulator of PEP synthase PpsR (kinase-PPPase family)
MKLTKSQLKKIIKEELESLPTVSEDAGSRFEELREVKEIMAQARDVFAREENWDAAMAMDRSLKELSAAMSHIR